MHEQGAAAQLTLLARVGAILGSGLARQETLERVAQLLVPAFAAWCAIDLEGEDGALERRVALPKAFPPLPPDAPHGPAIVMRTGEPELVREITEDALFAAARGNWGRLAEMRALALKSALCVPLTTGTRVVGTLSLLATERHYGIADLELMGEVARRTASAIEADRNRANTQMLFEASPTPMWVYDFETLAFLAVNDACIERYGYSREEFLGGMTIKDIRPPEEIPLLLADIESHHGAGSRVAREWRHLTRAGKLIDVEVTTGRIDFGGRHSVLVVAHDVSERKRLERRLTDAEKMEAIGRLAGGVAHDFNNLLTVISGYTEILLARDRGQELEEIARAARQAASLTRQLLAFSRRQVLHPTKLDLNEIVAGMETMMHRIIGDDVSVATRLAPDLAPVEADRAQIERVILNLAANARDAMPHGGALTLETRNVELSSHGADALTGPHVLLAVSDTGLGMDEKVRAHLFEPFFTTKEGGEGTGLGLATVFGVVKQSGGGIYVYSERGAGTTFKIYLPAAARGEDEPPAPAGEPEPAAGTETVLVVEDDRNVRDLVRLLLESNGYTVLTAQQADEAVRVCTELDVDLLLTDVVMPETSGRELAEQVAAAAPGVRILFMSGYSDEAVHRHGVLSEDAAFIEKPFTERSLTTKVREVLDN
ncbi:response regulator [Solirubrobacter sp. CPCC 204708]|uniref:histidine kinase n=1 Tax=Solirubrobacter deserti TaxID=2282478 RepID=A0ABT4RPM7_9ACTN|nr:response regulator [Solirubrobacter deserti]MBE2319239.1 response regulator [Solirubrobacter deserti]MDA0140245.1 response regulator [Solirubrobacter deserti]